jgi:His/Glu/Gln/Arg/opine family amino acid ABC transporter permease subunit
VADLPALRHAVQTQFPKLEIAPGRASEDEYVGIAARKSDLALVGALNEALDHLVADGTYAAIYEKWIRPRAALAADLEAVKGKGTLSAAGSAQESAGDGTRRSALTLRRDAFEVALPLLLKGAILTLQLTGLALLFGIPLGLLIALMRLSGLVPVRLVATWYVEGVRGTPLLIQILVIYFVLGTPEVGLNLPAFWAGAAALSLNAAAYISEILRAGIQSIDAGQMEAARALGMTYGQGMRCVVLPQTLRRVLPPLTNEAVALLKDSSLVTIIGVAELMQQGRQHVMVSTSATTVYLAVALIYLCMTLPLTYLVRALEARWQPISGRGTRRRAARRVVSAGAAQQPQNP